MRGGLSCGGRGGYWRVGVMGTAKKREARGRYTLRVMDLDMVGAKSRGAERMIWAGAEPRARGEGGL